MDRQKLPNFFILGAAKAGTTALYLYLKQHPQVYLPSQKEPHFFDSRSNYEQGVGFYISKYFNEADNFTARGEATPAYFHQPDYVIPRMKSIYGERCPKFIVLLRDPVERAWSHYLHKRRSKTEQEDFEQALKLEKERLKKDPTSWVGYFSDGLYAQQLEKWFDSYPKTNFLITLTESLSNRPHPTLEKIFSFLEIDKDYDIEIQKKHNVASKPRSEWLMKFLSRRSILKWPIKKILSKRTRRRIKVLMRKKNLAPLDKKPSIPNEVAENLRKRYRKDILKLQEMTGKDLSSWLPEN